MRALYGDDEKRRLIKLPWRVYPDEDAGVYLRAPAYVGATARVCFDNGRRESRFAGLDAAEGSNRKALDEWY